MAKAKAAGAPKKKAKKAAKAVALTAKPAGAKKGGEQTRPKSKGNAADALWRLAEHPLIGDLLAAGAMAAGAAIAEKGLSGKTKKGISSRVVKDAGKAAAAAIGLRLLTEVDEIKKVAKTAKAAKSAKTAKA